MAAQTRFGDVVADDRLDAHLAAGRVHQVVAQLERSHLGNVLVVRYGEHLLLGQLAESEAVFECKHAGRLCPCDPGALIRIKRYWRRVGTLSLARRGSVPPSGQAMRPSR